MIRHEVKKITHYEYWPFWIFYLPMVPLWLWYSLKSGSLLYFTAANPGMKFGGFFNYSKYKMQEKLSEKFRPKHFIIAEKNRAKPPAPLPFPFIAKPDQGERGKNVKVIDSQNVWERYLNNNSNDILVQEFIDLPVEFGVFYARRPGEKEGRILSVTGKRFLTYSGDGKTSLREFIESDSRAYFNKSYLYMKYHDKQEFVLPEGEKMMLEEIGNHNRGTYFYDRSDLITDELQTNMNSILSGIDGFFYGRLDIKAENEKELQKGNFRIIEFNGSNSEPTHVYDKDISYINALKEVHRHLQQQYLISKENMKNGHKPAHFGIFVKELWDFLF